MIISDMNGIEFIKIIKDLNPAQAILIISSENDDNELFQELIDIGVTSFIKKPFELLKILPKLIDFFSKEHYKEEIKKSKSADIVILEHRVDKLTDLLKKSLYEIDMIRQELSHKKNQSEEDIDNEELSFAADDLEIVGIETINMEESTSTPAPEITEETKVEDNNEATSCLHSSAKDFMLALRMMKIGKLINQI
jgi:response regulator RpfG family c-di-GMP phosphodiesterase